MPLTLPQSLIVAAAVGLLAGMHAAIWGMYKDAIHEGFVPARFARSLIVGAGGAVAVQCALGLDLRGPAPLVLLFGLAYAVERGVVEVWKTFWRDEDQSKYAIPMQFSVRGVPVVARGTRLAVGAAYVAAVALGLAAVARLDAPGAAAPRPAVVALLGIAVGAVVAVGGAWKDAPVEGFEPLKFLRSPLTTLGWALLLAQLSGSHLAIAVAALGYERATAETYKTFCFPTRPRGKFAGKPVRYPALLVRRRYFVPLYLAIWAAVAACAVAALRERAAAAWEAAP
jgi:hypothetical protein